MAFSVTDKSIVTEDRGPQIPAKVFSPKEPHEWLRGVVIIHADGMNPVVAVQWHERNDTALVAKMEELIALDVIFYRPRSELLQGIIRDECLQDHQMKFVAGPNSKIRDILSTARVPKDIQDAVMQDLQKIWAKTPG